MKTIAALAMLSACAFDHSVDTFDIEASLVPPLDVLIVIDDTPAVAHKLVPTATDLAGALVDLHDGASELRIGVTTTTTGSLRTSSLVPTGVIEHHYDLVGGEVHGNYVGTLQVALASLVELEPRSTREPRVLENTLRVLDEEFGRKARYLGVLIISAADDRSPLDTTEYAARIKKHGERVMVSTITDGAQRIEEFANWLDFSDTHRLEPGDRAVLSFGKMFEPIVYDDSCVPFTPMDLDACLVVASHITTAPLPRCRGIDLPTLCYEINQDSACPSGNLMSFGGPHPQYRPQITASCFVE